MTFPHSFSITTVQKLNKISQDSAIDRVTVDSVDWHVLMDHGSSVVFVKFYQQVSLKTITRGVQVLVKLVFLFLRSSMLIMSFEFYEQKWDGKVQEFTKESEDEMQTLDKKWNKTLVDIIQHHSLRWYGHMECISNDRLWQKAHTQWLLVNLLKAIASLWVCGGADCNDLHIETWPICPKDLPDERKWTLYIKAFASYHLTDRHTDRQTRPKLLPQPLRGWKQRHMWTCELYKFIEITGYTTNTSQIYLVARQITHHFQ